MADIKFTEQELSEIKNLQAKFQEKVFNLGQLRVERMRVSDIVRTLEFRESEVEKDFAALQAQEKNLLETLTKKYGEGSLNIADGTFIPVKAPEPKAELVLNQ